MDRSWGDSGSKAENDLRLTLLEREVRTLKVAVVNRAEALKGRVDYVIMAKFG